ncbi:putative vacuolar protein sorting-associated protein 13E [Gracilariopsis chorda]|uniref:Putative vacuolar protein sorting-associated protein 13E n=1 Tax=Gracilariopsis chorda TaxID=448386 RepID=A0A2V3IXP5_9FLOR|nr:putative vacuolar protein sorting-associated protein 13E [Gracilariopsis chorda]|eukprot:PXF46934.1 putative vacuolar protein sorting-associated protein 13E [Gracilariopsis chorda]
MLESVLADVLTNVLGQYLEGIDRESVSFGAWSGLVELRSVALRPEALAVLFETLGINLPVTVEAGFIGLLRLTVPWNAIGTTPVQITMEDITIMARPVRGDGSDDSELELRERRIKRARLATDDAVREASWGVSSETESKPTASWSSWLVSDELRARIIDNIQVHLKDIIIRFEDPFSDSRRPYFTSLVCQSLKIVSANEKWEEAFVERDNDSRTRKLIEVKGFHIDWAPITPMNEPGLSRGTSDHTSTDSKPFQTLEMLKQFITRETNILPSDYEQAGLSSLIMPVDGFMRILLSPNHELEISSVDLHELKPAVDLDIRFPSVTCNLNDVQYTSLLQTSVYLARISTRGIRPKSPKLRWLWAVDQLLPGFSARRARVLRLSERGIAATGSKRVLYSALRKSLLKARRTGLEEPKEIAQQLENLEACTDYDEVIAFRDWVDREVEADGVEWHSEKNEGKPTSTQQDGTTTSTFWRMLGYGNQQSQGSISTVAKLETNETKVLDKLSNPQEVKSGNQSSKMEHQSVLSLRVAFVLHGVTVNLDEGGFPQRSRPRLSLSLQNLRVGFLLSSAEDLIAEAVLGSVEVWDVAKSIPLVYNRFQVGERQQPFLPDSIQSAYPTDVGEAIESIRDGSNPASDVLMQEDTYQDYESESLMTDVIADLNCPRSPSSSRTNSASPSRSGRRRGKSRISMSRDLTPPTFRVTEDEFLGSSKGTSSFRSNAAAFRYIKRKTRAGGEGPTAPATSLDVSIATLEAVVDGPKGSFVWGLKFWRPRGLAQDPIMAFLGAAAGAQIAELRMEIEEALLANKVPLQINAVILAPRFIIPGASEQSPSIVVNMGILGVCTSDHSPTFTSDEREVSRRRVRYSNYVMTLDNLGVYFCPDLKTAASKSLERRTMSVGNPDLLLGRDFAGVDTTGVERIIRPFSLRFMLQTLRDASVVQVAHHPSRDGTWEEDKIAKVRIRGRVPEVSLILSQGAFQHLLVTVEKWSRELLPKPTEDLNQNQSSAHSWPISSLSERSSLRQIPVQGSRRLSESQRHEGQILEALPTALASYDIRVLLKKVSIELQERANVRLLTVTASQLEGNITKTRRTNLQAWFSLQSWSVTDSSRGSTAAYRRLAYAGNLSGSKGVSPPRSLSGASDAHEQDVEEDKNFITVRYNLDFGTKRQRIQFHFLSLHVICVRETYIRLAKYFRTVRKYVKANRFRGASPPEYTAVVEDKEPVLWDGTSSPSASETPRTQTGLGVFETYISSEFDGLNCQLIASGGVVALLEMKESKIQYHRGKRNVTKAWGECRYFTVQDLTSPLRDHVSVITYEKPDLSVDEMFGTNLDNQSTRDHTADTRDEWVLSIPHSKNGDYNLRANFRGIKVTFLYRFCDVISQYFRVLWDHLKPILDLIADTHETLQTDAQTGHPNSLNQQASKLGINLGLDDLSVRLPRHSACSSEAVNIHVPSVRVSNSVIDDEEVVWKCSFSGAQFATEYILQNISTGPVSVSSSFLTDFMAEFVAKSVNQSSLFSSSSSPRTEILFNAYKGLCMNLSEAQYTILYFVMTENLAETVTELDLSLGIDSPDHEIPDEAREGRIDNTKASDFKQESFLPIADGDIDPQLDTSKDSSLETITLVASAPMFILEVSRGWDVAQESCKILGVRLKNCKMVLRRFIPARLVFEVDAKLLSLEDLRSESTRRMREFAVPLSMGVEPGSMSSARTTDSLQNFSIVYDKLGADRPAIVMLLSRLQIDMPLDLLRDLTYIAIPGWPFLSSSAFPPEFTYIGRTLNIVLSDSQLLLQTHQHYNDRRALAMVGEFEVKMEWMRHTGAKIVSLQTRQMEISCVGEIQSLEEEHDILGAKSLSAKPIEASKTPLLYPTNCFVEYVGPDVDDNGCRLSLTSDSFLCLINVGDIQLLQAVGEAVLRKRDSYISTRNWKHPAGFPGQFSAEMNPKKERRRKALKSMSVSVTISALRGILSDHSSGQFIPVLETKLSSLRFNSHGESIFQVEGEVSMDLFNSEKGWWEPALEPWQLSASMSQGLSGSVSYVIRSDQRANFNITPTTITALPTVLRTLSAASAKTSNPTKLHSQRLRLYGADTARRPAVAAFFVKNELGIPINMNLPSTSHRLTISHGSEIEIGAQSESLVSSGADDLDKSRESALRCSLTVSSYFSKTVSAGEVGLFPLTFFPTGGGKDELIRKPLYALWEVRMSNGVPLCTVRSQYRVINQTKCSMGLLISKEEVQTSEKNVLGDGIIRLEQGESFSVPIQDIKSGIAIRPFNPMGNEGSSIFDWSMPLPSMKWLRRMARMSQQTAESKTSQKRKQRSYSQDVFVSCKALGGSQCDFFVKVVPNSSHLFGTNRPLKHGWIDVSLLAPVVLQNNLPRSVYYKVSRNDKFGLHQSESSDGFGETIFAAGRVNPFEAEQLHFSGENMNYSLLSLAFDNVQTSPNRRRISIPEFGPPINLSDVESGKVKAIFSSPDKGSTDSRKQARKDFRCLVYPDKSISGKFSVSAGVWVRNRSDTTLEICSRGSFYAGGSQSIILRQRPPFEEPDEYVCFEGPYLSVRIPANGREQSFDNDLDSSSWWTTPSSLQDMKKPVAVNVCRRSLILDVRPADGIEQTKIVTIRNQSWILNSTMKPLQWCQASSLDAHGNCPTRSVSMLDPGRASAVHWETRSSYKAVHLRLSTEDGYSDWIWSPAVPLNIGFSRELPAKMYRPKTHEQHIARVDSKKIGGGSRALIIFPEDRQNPPYRIVNFCTERAVSFAQIGSHERPWLVRGGKSTRYSWDDPLAPPGKRMLSVRILERKDLLEARSGLAHPAHEAFDLSIDVLGERVLVLSEGYDPKVVISVSVQGATKIVTFADEGSDVESHSPKKVAMETRNSTQTVPAPVPVVAWDDISHTTNRDGSLPVDRNQKESLATLSDYPPKPKGTPQRPDIGTSSNSNTAVYLNSIGVSVIDAEPSELIYARAHGILMNVETNSDAQVVSVHIQEFQIDNQLHQTIYPVLLSVTNPQAGLVQSSSGEMYAESGAIALTINRKITNGDIVMIQSFQSAINPFHLCFEDKIILKMLRFLSDASIVGSSTPMDVGGRTDGDFRIFQTLLPTSPNSGGNLASRRQVGSLPSSRRIYVHDFKINSSLLRLTSAGSGAAVAKAAGLGLTVSTILGLILNVENCEFQLAALQVQNVFDSLHHFAALVREYYMTQLSNQRMKLLASNALVGNPAALFDAVGTGAKDFFNESGKAKGSAEFIASVGRGSKSLLSHTVGGIMESVSGIPRAVSSGLEKAVGDNAYLAERQRIRMGSGARGSASKNPAQGFATGALSFAHGISSGVTGFIREPVQGAKQGGAGGLLKGIGKAFIGGVAKPVAGAIDFIAEPAAGLSRQIADDRAWVPSVVERPPRAFRGEGKRVERYDRRFSIGVCLYKAVKEYNSITLDTGLMDWVELSDRDGRSDADSDLWAWEIIRQYARSMPGWKKAPNTSQRGSRAASSTETRVEKTRVAMTTDSDILVATLDCKLVAWISLWCDANYDVWSDGKDVVISGRMGETQGGEETRGGTIGGNLVNAPWDAPYVERKRRPRAGERFEERVTCGSAAASDDLRRRVVQTVRLLQEEREAKPGIWRSANDASQSLELFALGSGGEGDNEMKMQAGVSKSSAGALELGRLGRAASGGWRGRGEALQRDRRSASLERTVRRLSSSRRPSRRGGLRFIVVNKLETHMTLVMREEQLYGTTWSGNLAREIEAFDAQAIETKGVENGDEITGCVVYAIVDEKKEQVGEVAIELFCGRDRAASFTTKSSVGFHATFEREGSHGAFVFEVHQAPDQEQESESERRMPENVERTPAETVSDENMVQQLVDIGFSLDDAVVALAEADGDMVKAVDILTRK